MTSSIPEVDFKDAVVAVDVLADFLGLTKERVQQLVKDDVVSRVGHGSYRLIPSVRGYIEYLKKQIPGPRARAGMTASINTGEDAPDNEGSEKDDPSFLLAMEPRTALLTEQARSVMIKNERELGLLLLASDAETLFGEVLSAVTATINAMPNTVAPLVVGVTEQIVAEAVLRDSADAMLRNLSAACQRIGHVAHENLGSKNE